MKSIEDTLKIIQDIIKKFPADIDIALIGDTPLSCTALKEQPLILTSVFIQVFFPLQKVPRTPDFYSLLLRTLPERFEARMIKGSEIQDDPFKHDVIFIEDKMGEFMRIDF